jgi:hypothetical protein
MLLLAAIANYMMAIVFTELLLTHFAILASQLGSALFLCAFSMLLLTCISPVNKSVITAFRDYFSSRRTMERRLLFYAGKRSQINQLFLLRKARLHYLNQQQRKRLLKQCDRKQTAS